MEKLLKSLANFFMPVFYRIRLLFEEKRSAKLRSKAMLQLCNSEPNWIPDDIPELSIINESVKPFSFVNVVTQELFSINLFEKDEPAENVGFKECKMVPMFTLNHFVNLYNQSLSSGFWSLFLKPVTLLDEKYFRIMVFKDNENYNKHMIIIIKYDNDYVKIFKFSNT
jgi:hypothetical protein